MCQTNGLSLLISSSTCDATYVVLSHLATQLRQSSRVPIYSQDLIHSRLLTEEEKSKSCITAISRPAQRGTETTQFVEYVEWHLYLRVEMAMPKTASVVK